MVEDVMDPDVSDGIFPHHPWALAPMRPFRLNVVPAGIKASGSTCPIPHRSQYFRWRLYHRNQSTTAPHTASESLHPPPAENAVPPSRRSLRPYIYAAAFLLLGTASGRFIDLIINPPPLPAPGSDADAALINRLNKDIDALPLVQKLRRARYSPDSPEGWREVGASSPALQAWRKDGEVGSLISHSMSGWRGLGTQRTFFNPSRGELVKIMWFGSGLSGWPGVVHGGAIATVCNDGLGELLGLENGERAGKFPDPTSLSLTYLAPTKAHGFYVFKAQRHPSSSSTSAPTSNLVSSNDPSTSGSAPYVAGAVAASHLPPHKDLTKQQQSAGSGGWVLGSAPAVQVDGTLETLEGKVCVKATAAWSIEQVMGRP